MCIDCLIDSCGGCAPTANQPGGSWSNKLAPQPAGGIAPEVMYAHHALREELIATARQMNSTGINQGTSGNISVRVSGADGDGFLITPSGLPYDTMEPEQLVYMDLASAGYYGDFLPSSEWRMHLDIYRARPAAQAILHAHPTYSTALAVQRREIPAFHYMVGAAGGKKIPCAGYATFGTQELSDEILSALGDTYSGCLMANHGMLCFGRNLGKALGLAVEIESLSRQYMITLAVGEPAVLDDAEMDIILVKFKTYGKQQKDLDALMSGSEFVSHHAVVPPQWHGPVVKGATSSDDCWATMPTNAAENWSARQRERRQSASSSGGK